MKFVLPALFALLFLFPAWSNADNLEKQLASDYIGKTLTLRHFYEGDHLRFRPDGTLQGDAPIGPWTLDGQIAVEQVHLSGSVLEFRGRRITVVFDAKNKPVDQWTTLDRYSGKQRKEMEKALRKQQVRVEIDLPSSTPSQDDLALSIHAVFLMLGESMTEVVPHSGAPISRTWKENQPPCLRHHKTRFTAFRLPARNKVECRLRMPSSIRTRSIRTRREKQNIRALSWYG